MDQNNMTSILSFSIGSVQDSDFGVYNCTVTNSIGANSFIFEIQLKGFENIKLIWDNVFQLNLNNFLLKKSG